MGETNVAEDSGAAYIKVLEFFILVGLGCGVQDKTGVMK